MTTPDAMPTPAAAATAAPAPPASGGHAPLPVTNLSLSAEHADDVATAFGLSHLVAPRIAANQADDDAHPEADTEAGGLTDPPADPAGCALAHLVDLVREFGGIEPLSRVIAREMNAAHDHLDAIAHLVSEVRQTHEDVTAAIALQDTGALHVADADRRLHPPADHQGLNDGSGRGPLRNALRRSGERSAGPALEGSPHRSEGMLASSDPGAIGEIVQHRASLGELTDWVRSHLIPLAGALGGRLTVSADETMMRVPTVAIAGMMIEAVRRAILAARQPCDAELRFRLDSGRWVIIEFVDHARNTAADLLRQLDVKPEPEAEEAGASMLPLVHADRQHATTTAPAAVAPTTMRQHWCRLVRSVAGSTVIYDDADGGLVVLVRYSIFHQSVVNVQRRMIGS